MRVWDLTFKCFFQSVCVDVPVKVLHVLFAKVPSVTEVCDHFPTSALNVTLRSV